MTVDWDSYEIYDPGTHSTLDELSRADARKAYTRLMDAKSGRIEMLTALLRANGVVLNQSQEAIQALNDWFAGNVQPDPSESGRLLADWYSVVNDVALFLGDVIIARAPALRWEFYVWGGKRARSYQRHVIMGFPTENPKNRLSLDIDMAVAVLGQRRVLGLDDDPQAFQQWIERACRRV